MAVAGAKPRDLDALQTRLLLREAEMGRFSLHPVIRQYAYEKLAAEAEQLIATQNNHAQYFSHFVSSRANQINSHEFRPACDALELEIENIRSAWLYSAKTGAAARMLEMLHPLAKYHIFMERNEQGSLLFASVTGEKLPRSLMGWILTYRVYCHQNLRQTALTPDLLAEAESLLRAAHDREGLCLMLLRMVFHRFSGQNKGLEALEVLEEAQTLADELKHQEYSINARYMRASIYSYMGRYAEAEAILLPLIAMKPQNPRLYGDCLWILGMTEFRREHFATALEQFNKVLEFDRYCQFEAHYAHVLIISGSCEQELGRYQEAEQSFLQCRSYYEAVKNPGATAIAYERLGGIYFRTNRVEEGCLSYRKAADIYKSLKTWPGYVQTLANFASSFETAGLKDERAREIYQEALEIAEREQVPNQKGNALRIAATVEMMFENYPLALSHTQEAIRIFIKLEDRRMLRTVSMILLQYALVMENMKLAAWLKSAFLADSDTEDDVHTLLRENEIASHDFPHTPNLIEIQQVLDSLLLRSAAK